MDFRECVGDDLNVKMALSFPRGIKTKPGETVLFSYIVFKSRAHRDRVNAKVMKDPRLAKMMNPKAMPFDVKRICTADSKPSSKHDALMDLGATSRRILSQIKKKEQRNESYYSL